MPWPDAACTSCFWRPAGPPPWPANARTARPRRPVGTPAWPAAARTSCFWRPAGTPPWPAAAHTARPRRPVGTPPWPLCRLFDLQSHPQWLSVEMSNHLPNLSPKQSELIVCTKNPSVKEKNPFDEEKDR